MTVARRWSSGLRRVWIRAFRLFGVGWQAAVVGAGKAGSPAGGPFQEGAKGAAERQAESDSESEAKVGRVGRLASEENPERGAERDAEIGCQRDLRAATRVAQAGSLGASHYQ